MTPKAHEPHCPVPRAAARGEGAVCVCAAAAEPELPAGWHWQSNVTRHDGEDCQGNRDAYYSRGVGGPHGTVWGYGGSPEEATRNAAAAAHKEAHFRSLSTREQIARTLEEGRKNYNKLFPHQVLDVLEKLFELAGGEKG